ncbi:hypothetical protein Tco_1224393, partial [Tanacetum coccineum]
MTLDPKSVDNFKELSQKFLEEFSQQKRPIQVKKITYQGVPPVLRISAFMQGHGHLKLAKKLNDKIPKMVDEMFERVGAFIREAKKGSEEEAVQGSSKGTWGHVLPTQEETRSHPSLRHQRRSWQWKVGHNTNDCYHLKKQIKEVVASGKLVHLVRDIRQGNQRNRGQARGNVK